MVESAELRKPKHEDKTGGNGGELFVSFASSPLSESMKQANNEYVT